MGSAFRTKKHVFYLVSENYLYDREKKNEKSLLSLSKCFSYLNYHKVPECLEYDIPDQSVDIDCLALVVK